MNMEEFFEAFDRANDREHTPGRLIRGGSDKHPKLRLRRDGTLQLASWEMTVAHEETKMTFDGSLYFPGARNNLWLPGIDLEMLEEDL